MDFSALVGHIVSRLILTMANKKVEVPFYINKFLLSLQLTYTFWNPVGKHSHMRSKIALLFWSIAQRLYGKENYCYNHCSAKIASSSSILFRKFFPGMRLISTSWNPVGKHSHFRSVMTLLLGLVAWDSLDPSTSTWMPVNGSLRTATFLVKINTNIGMLVTISIIKEVYTLLVT